MYPLVTSGYTSAPTPFSALKAKLSILNQTNPPYTFNRFFRYDKAIP